MISEFSVDLARLQFAVLASYHFIFVPLTLGLSWMLFTMECLYVKTGNVIYKEMTRFWGKLFGINFAIGVLSGLTMEFQFGLNWGYYSQYVGDIFGTPLAIEGLLAFMLESTFVGIFFFGWDKLSKKQHLIVTLCVALGSSLSALLILVANGYMQFPAGAYFDPENMRMQTESLLTLVLNPMAQIGFIHTVIAGYLTGAVFVMGISAYYLVKGRDIGFAKRSFAVAAGFGLVAAIMVAYVGDENGIDVFKQQPMKLAAIEAVWETEEAPANFNVIAFPSQSEQKNLFKISIPGFLGILVTHSTTQEIVGIHELEKQNMARIETGRQAYHALEKIRTGDTSPEVKAIFEKYKDDLGYGMLLKRYENNVMDATPAQIKQAARDTVPNVFSLFWAFRLMVLVGVLMIASFLFAFISVYRGKGVIWQRTWFLRWMTWAIPLPILACSLGWFVTEHGRQPWTVYEVLPTFLSASSLSAVDVMISFIIFVSAYATLLSVGLFLMFKFARKGPSALHLGKYHFEQKTNSNKM